MADPKWMVTANFWNHIDNQIYDVSGWGNSRKEAYENMTSLNNCGKYQNVEYYEM